MENDNQNHRDSGLSVKTDACGHFVPSVLRTQEGKRWEESVREVTTPAPKGAGFLQNACPIGLR